MDNQVTHAKCLFIYNQVTHESLNYLFIYRLLIYVSICMPNVYLFIRLLLPIV